MIYDNDIAVLRITDGTREGTVDLLSRDGSGISLIDWTPAAPQVKGDGIWVDSPFHIGRKLLVRSYGNVTEVFTLAIAETDMDRTIETIQKLRRLLEKAVQYWTTRWQKQPVWIEKRGSRETKTSYALIKNFRTPGEDNPFASPFFGVPSILDEVELEIERDQWTHTPPGEGECQVIDTLRFTRGRTDEAGLAFADFFPSSGVDNVYVDETFEKVYSDPASLIAGDVSGRPHHIVLRVRQSLTVLEIKNRKITKSWVRFFHNGTQTGEICRVRVSVEEQLNPPPISDYADFVSRKRSSVCVYTELPAGLPAGSTQIDITPLMEYLVTRPDWEDGNYFNIFIESEFSDSNISRDYRSYQAFPSGMPFIRAFYLDGRQSNQWAYNGSGSGCSGHFVGNYDTLKNIDIVMKYDASANTYTSFSPGSAPDPFELFPNPFDVGDILYLGTVVNSNLNPQQRGFFSVVFDLAQAFPSGVETVWEYYDNDSSGWETLTVYDGTADPSDMADTALQKTGVNVIFFDTPDAWDRTTVNNIIAVYIRLRVTSGSGTQVPAVHGRLMYAVANASVTIRKEDIGGDIPALAKVEIHNRSHYSDTLMASSQANHFFVGLRSMDRGRYFSPFLPVINQFSVADMPLAVFGSEYLDPGGGAVAGWTGPLVSAYSRDGLLRYGGSTTFAMAPAFRWELDPRQYDGVYRAFFRFFVSSGVSSGDFLARLVVSAGLNLNQTYTPTKSLAISGTGYENMHLVELGRIELPGLDYTAGDDTMSRFHLTLELQSTNSSSIIMPVDVILLPVDEWAGEFFAGDTGAGFLIGRGCYLEIDSVAMPKASIRATARVQNTGAIYCHYRRITNGPLILQANADQQLWFVAARDVHDGAIMHAPLHLVHEIRIQKQQRYLGSRGRK